MEWNTLRSDPKVVAAIVGAVSAIFVSIINNLINSNRSKAEIRKLQAETAKLKVETEQLVEAKTAQIKSETEQIVEETKQDIADSVSYKLSSSEELVLFGDGLIEEFDFKFIQAKCWKDNTAYGERASGEFEITENTLNVERLNGHGRLSIVLKKYVVAGLEKDYLPKKVTFAGDRKLHLSFKAKSTRGRQLIRVVAKDKNENEWLAQKRTFIEQQEWIRVDAYLRVPSDRDFFIRIDNETPEVSPTSCQFTDLILTERI